MSMINIDHRKYNVVLKLLVSWSDLVIVKPNGDMKVIGITVFITAT